MRLNICEKRIIATRFLTMCIEKLYHCEVRADFSKTVTKENVLASEVFRGEGTLSCDLEICISKKLKKVI